MGRLVIHLGLPKSGSTAIQRFLSGNRAALDELGLHWCESLRGPNHVQLAVACGRQINHLSKTVGVHNERDRARLRSRVARQLGAELRNRNSVLVSTEHLSSVLTTPEDVGSLANLVRGFADDVLLVGVLRRADYWLPSAYAEAVLNNKPVEFDAEFVRSRAPLLDHQSLLRRWQDGFGADKVRLVPMLEDDKSDPNAVPLRMLEALDVPDARNVAWQAPAQLAHQTLSAHGTQLLHAANPVLPRGGLRPGRFRQQVQGFIAAHYPGASLKLPPAAAAELDRLGWRHTGIDGVPAAVGELWPQWREQPDAEVRPLPEVDDGQVRELLTELRAAGITTRAGTYLDAGLRRVAVRVARR